MAKRKEPSLEDLQKEVRKDLNRWKDVRKKGTRDPHWPDGTNLNLIRNHVSYGVKQLKERCKRDKVRPCPKESRVKVPPKVSWDFCVRNSPAGPCKERRKRRRPKRRRKGRGRGRTRAR